MGSKNGKTPKVFRPGDLDDAALVARRFDRHLEEDRLAHDLTNAKLDKLITEMKGLQRGMRKLFAMQTKRKA